MRAEHLYVHVPFCARRCVYCDFSIAVRSLVPETEYLDAVAREMRVRHAASALRLRTLYFGGGTPSKLSPDAVQRLIDLVTAQATLDQDAEVTLEANPEDVDADAAVRWQRAGINRVSLGVQSFDAGVLEWMHRSHSAEQSAVAVTRLQDAGITNISIDLIFALPAQLARSWQRDLETALRLDVAHISMYGLTIEPHTPLGRWVARRTVVEAPETDFESEFLLGTRTLGAEGFEHYEVSNYARPDRRSRHNSAYWARKPYGGVGPSAHEFDGNARRWNRGPYAAWLRDLQASRDPLEGSEVLSADQVTAECVYLGLRTSAGLPITAAERGHVSRWLESGWANVAEDGRLRLTASGWLRLDTLAADLTHFRSR